MDKTHKTHVLITPNNIVRNKMKNKSSRNGSKKNKNDIYWLGIMYVFLN
jgi:hypothetical protein